MGDESDGIPYDDDFEEASDDAGGKSLGGEILEASVASASSGFGGGYRGGAPQLPAAAPSGGAGTGPRQRRPRASEPPAVGSGMGAFEAEAPVELARAAGSAPSAGQRVVRGKVSVAGSTDDLRPSTGDSGPHASQAPQAPGKPMWLQFNDVGAAPRRDPAHSPPTGPLGGDIGGGGRGGRRSRPPLEPDSVDAALLLPPAGPRRPASGSGRSRRSAETAATGDPFEIRTSGNGDGDDRKSKRLQQEIARLTQRLQEAELFSAQDDMLPKFTLDEVEVGCQIAQGGFSSVHHAVWRSTPCALKKIFDPIITAELRAEFENEVRMLRLLRHPHIVVLMAVCRVPPALSILTEVVTGGSLFEVLHGSASSRPRRCIEAEPSCTLPVIRQAAGALAYMHSMSMVHRDVKSHNVLLFEGSRPIAKLCDFGLARLVSELCTGTMQWAGTAQYMAPELFAKRRYNESVDVFAFGTMTWEVASTEIPHANMDPVDIAHRVQNKDGAGLAVTHAWPKSLKALLRSTLAVQPEGRPSMVQVAKELDAIILDFPAPND